MQELKGFVEKIEASKEFKEIKEELILCSFFNMFSKELGSWQVSYYDQKNDKMISFSVEDNKVKREESKVFREKNSKINQLNLDDVKIDFNNAIKKTDKIKHDNYKSGSVNKKIVILQVIEKPIWNVTYLTSDFKIVNVKLDAISGEVISHQLSSALSLGAQ